jgi:hypothetical protein
MTETANTPTDVVVADKPLFARLVGILFAPRETFAAVVARPRWFGMLALVAVASAVLVGGFMLTAVGQQTFLDAFERQGNAQQLEVMRRIAPYMGYIYAGSALIIGPLFQVLIAGVLFGVFMALGGDARFKQVLAVLVHASVVSLVGQLILVPVQYVMQSAKVVTNASVFFPMLDDQSFLFHLASRIDLFTIWFLVVLSIGLGVLYRRKSGSIATVFLILYALIALGIAAVQAARS